MRFYSVFKSWLAHPLTRGLDIDDPHTTYLRRQIVREKIFLREIYDEWYALITLAVPTGEGSLLEIGSGPGFLKDVIPDIITSDVFYCSSVDIVLDGCKMPFEDSTLRGIVMTDVFHHLAMPRGFLEEAARCVRPGGVLVMIEPWVTLWSKLVYKLFDAEPFRPKAVDWSVPTLGPLSGANSALPWIVFHRDRKQFESEFQEWRIKEIKPMMPFRYVVSGGVSFRELTPVWTYGFWRNIENALRPWMSKLAMFAHIVLVRIA